jgi:Na+-transporting NADH:ubiquinone oxidoreductase subunit F
MLTPEALTQILMGVVMFTAIVIGLVIVILVARRWLVPKGDVAILINDDRYEHLTPESVVKILEELP